MEKIVPLWPIGYKVCAVFEGIQISIFLILDSGFEYMNVLSCVHNELQYLYRRFNTTRESSTEVNYFDLPHVC